MRVPYNDSAVGITLVDTERHLSAKQGNWLYSKSGMIRIRWWPLLVLWGWLMINVVMVFAAIGCGHRDCTAPPWFADSFASLPLRLFLEFTR